MFLERMTSAQAEKVINSAITVVMPVGSTEQHGPQCALGTDFLVPRHIAEMVDDMGMSEEIVVMPTVPFGICDYHMSFSGTINIGYDGLYMILSKMTKAMISHGARRFLVLNGHGGNTPAIDQTALDVYRAGGLMASLDWWSVVGQIDSRFANGGHGDVLETAAMMAVDECAVDLSLCKDMGDVRPTDATRAKYIQVLEYKGGSVRLPRDTKEMAPSGWFGPGDPREATKSHGEEMLKVIAGYTKDLIRELQKIKLG